MEQKLINFTNTAAADLIQLAQYGNSKFVVDYDEEADVLYVNFGKPQKAETSTQEDGIIKRKKGKKIIGLTILNASRFKKTN